MTVPFVFLSLFHRILYQPATASCYSRQIPQNKKRRCSGRWNVAALLLNSASAFGIYYLPLSTPLALTAKPVSTSM